MDPEKLEINKRYLYQGSFLKRTELQYVGTIETYYGTAYQFDLVDQNQWLIGARWKLPADGLNDIIPLTTQPITPQ